MKGKLQSSRSNKVVVVGGNTVSMVHAWPSLELMNILILKQELHKGLTTFKKLTCLLTHLLA